MPSRFDLSVTTDYPNRTAEFSLRDSSGVQLAYRQTDFKTISISHQQGLFDLRNYLRLYVEVGKERAAVAEIGVCIAEEVLGAEIFAKLWASQVQRTLRMQLPGAADTENHLAAALARVPWEIARPKAGADTLGERNLVVRVVHDMQRPASTPIELAADEALRVLFVFAEARGSHPLGARQERRELLRLFENEIYPKRKVVAHFLTHGVTRERLEAQVRENGGYHVVHWSGHGHRNVLELARPNGARNRISGSGLLDILTQPDAVLPRFVFLSACHSGDILPDNFWDDFLAIAQGKKPKANVAEKRPLDFAELPGFASAAHALLQGGVPSVVAMRYAVGDDYAREVAVEFYRALLAHAQPKSAAAALTMARQAMLDRDKHGPARFDACDHATPVLYGEDRPGLTLVKGRSPNHNPRNPRLHRIAELTTAGHEHFVGRTWELVGLGSNFIGSHTGSEGKPVAVITGLGGMGKTALTAEALALWESRFKWVLLYEAKPHALGFDATLRDIHMKLLGELELYHHHVRANPDDAIYRDATSDFTGRARLERLTRNLLSALKHDPILIVLDNFETNLKPQAKRVSGAGLPVWACQDPAWDHCLALLARELSGSPSRVLIICRRPLAALRSDAAHSVLLGPLPGAEAALFLKEHPALRRLLFSSNVAEQALAQRLLAASRFHPLLMNRLAKLAENAVLRPQLLAAIEALEKTRGFARLPALFATTPGNSKELAYLEDALASSLDQCIRDLSPKARRLLWMIAMANHPVSLELLKSVWSGKVSYGDPLRTDNALWFHELDPRAKVVIEPLLPYLVSVGLVTEERTGSPNYQNEFTCHELVRERIRAWMVQHPGDLGDVTDRSMWNAYAERLEIQFGALRDQGSAAASEVGSRVIVYCSQAGDWGPLSRLAESLVSTSDNPQLLEALVPHLKTAFETAEKQRYGPGRSGRQLLNSIADALLNIGRPDASLPFYERAANWARRRAENGMVYGWYELSIINDGRAQALFSTGNYDAARACRLEISKARIALQTGAQQAVKDPEKRGLFTPDQIADVMKPARYADIEVIRNELEILRIDISQGQRETALPKLRMQLTRLKKRWNRVFPCKSKRESPDYESIGLAFVTALELAQSFDCERGNLKSALRRLSAALEVLRALKCPPKAIAEAQMGRANVLTALGRFGEAAAELEYCFKIFKDDPLRKGAVLSSFALLFSEKGDFNQAVTQERRALAIFDQLPYLKERVFSHSSLAHFLERAATESALAESLRHQLAALIYQDVAGLGDLGDLRHSFEDSLRKSVAAGAVLAVPRVAALLADPSFAPLVRWLHQRDVDFAKLQAAVDHIFDKPGKRP